MSETLILSAASSLPKLEKLGLASCKNVDFSNIMSVEHSLDNLKYLVLDFTDTADNDIYTMTDILGRLEFLSLKCCNKITEEGHYYLTKRLTSIKSANFKYCKSFDSEALQNLLLNSKDLKALKLGDNSLSDYDLYSILFCGTRVRELTFSAMNSSHEFTYDCFSLKLHQSRLSERLKILHLSNNQ